MAQVRLPQLPSLAQLGMTPTEPAKSSDGLKKVPYQAIRPKNVRTYQSVSTSPPVRAKPAVENPYPTFTITSHGEAIAKMISEHPVIAVDSPTGTGKTRYIPYLMASRGKKVRVAIPTTVAVRDSYRFQKEHSKLKVGFAAGREIHYSDDDDLVYGTTGHFTQRILGLIKDNQRQKIRRTLGDVFFIDEVHASTTQITLLIGLIRHLFTAINNEYVGPKIVFSTATFNHGDIMDHFPNFPIYRVEVPAKPIETIYLKPGDKHQPLLDDPNHLISLVVKEELDRWKHGEKGHGIVFRPGVFEVEETIAHLESSFGPNEPIEFYPAYSNLSPTEMDEIFRQSENMKVIIGTNSVETGITIEDVKYIVNDFLEKIVETSPTGGNRLILTLIPKAAAYQRRGRTGRTIPGRDYRLITEANFQQLKDFRIREIDRVPIYEIVLQLIDAGLDPLAVLRIYPIRYEQARKVLLDLGMIEMKNDRYFVTEIGNFISSIPLSIQNSYMVYLGYQQFLSTGGQDKLTLRSILAAASMLESYGPSYFYIPRRNRNESFTDYLARKDAHIDQYHEKFRGPSDIHTLVNIFWEMLVEIDIAKKYDQSTRNHFMDYVREWSNENSMNNKKLKEYFNVLRDIESIIESKLNRETSIRQGLPLGRDLPEGGFTDLGNRTAAIFCLAYQNNHLVKQSDRKGRVIYVDQKNGIEYKINRNASFNMIDERDSPEEIIVAQTIEVVGKGGKVNLAGLIVPKGYF